MTGKGPGRPRSTEADAAILRAALELLTDKGIDAVGIEQVARRAGVTRATIYRRFPDRIRMLIAAIHSGYGLPPEPPEPPTTDDVETMLHHWAQALADPGARRLIRRLMTTLHDYPELAEAYTKVSIEPRTRAVRRVLADAQARGEFPADTDLEVIREILTGAISTHLLTRPDTDSAPQIERFLLTVLRHTTYRRI